MSFLFTSFHHTKKPIYEYLSSKTIALFKRRSTLKRSIKILQIMEHKARTNQIFDSVSTLRALDDENALIADIGTETTNLHKWKFLVVEVRIKTQRKRVDPQNKLQNVVNNN
jgi:hypothetical protein